MKIPQPFVESETYPGQNIAKIEYSISTESLFLDGINNERHKIQWTLIILPLVC
jgi:hypothetical protein